MQPSLRLLPVSFQLPRLVIAINPGHHQPSHRQPASASSTVLECLVFTTFFTCPHGRRRRRRNSTTRALATSPQFAGCRGPCSLAEQGRGCANASRLEPPNWPVGWATLATARVKESPPRRPVSCGNSWGWSRYNAVARRQFAGLGAGKSWEKLETTLN